MYLIVENTPLLATFVSAQKTINCQLSQVPGSSMLCGISDMDSCSSMSAAFTTDLVAFTEPSYSLREFAESQRRNPDTAKCCKCVEILLAQDAVEDDEYEDPKPTSPVCL